MLGCHMIWGFQPLYFALDDSIDTAALLAYRIIWVFIICLLILKIRGLIPELTSAIKNKDVMKREIPAAFLLLADWSIYLIAVRCNRIMECVMGYYIMPLVMVFLGIVVYKEKVKIHHIAAILLIVVGIVLSSSGFGAFPWITLSLSLAFAVYSALKKSLSIDSIASMVIETMVMLPIAIIYLIFFAPEASKVMNLSLSQHLFALGTGIITGLPMILFTTGLKSLSMADAGILEYMSPTFGLISSIILGEVLTEGKLMSFAFIWVGIIIYLVFEYGKLTRKRST